MSKIEKELRKRLAVLNRVEYTEEVRVARAKIVRDLTSVVTRKARSDRKVI